MKDADQTGFGSDEYTKGMVCYEADDADSTPTLNRWEYGLLKPFLGRRILEIGAGAGRITSLLISEGNFDELVAVEPSAHFRQLFESKMPPHPNVRLVAATTRELLPQYHGYFDSVFSAHVMEHIQDDRGFLQDQIDLVVPGGAVVALVPALPFLYSELDKRVGHFRRYNKRSVHVLLTQLRHCKLEALFYSNALGVLGSLYFSKIRKINYQGTPENRKNFFRVYHYYSEYVIPCVRLLESRITVPIGLSLTLVLRRI